MPLPGSQSFEVVAEGAEKMTPQDRNILAEFQRKVIKLQRAVTGALDASSTAKTRIGLMKRAALEAPGSNQYLLNEVNALDDKVDDVLRALRGGRDLSDIPPPSITAGQRHRSAHPPLSATPDPVATGAVRH